MPKKAPPWPTHPVTSDHSIGWIYKVGQKSFSSLKRVDVLRTHVSGDETFDSVMDAHNSVSAVDAITDERTNSRVHSASRCTDVHHTQRVTALKLK